MTDEEKQRDQAVKIERANSYRDMMNSWAWKDLMIVMAQEKKQQIENILSLGSKGDLDFARGFVKGLDWVENEANFVLEAK